MNEINTTEFQPWPKIARLNRQITVTEKIDGTNAQVAVSLASDAQKAGHLSGPYLTVSGGFVLCAGSRTRWITPTDDNYGFAKWVLEHADELVKLGPGRHFGEWWGRGIQRNYGLQERRFSLFNTERWCLADQEPKLIPSGNPKAEPKYQDRLPACVGLVPVLYAGGFDSRHIQACLDDLRNSGSHAVPGFMNPEGLVVFHHAANTAFKVTLENDEVPKGLVG